ncbi:hypothetical protein ONA24_04340 [Mycoplasmopsis cynos]|uniref:hypothetical protein n=1 Tax=Mycoplasmopsis cynos TaxID=171284 RepID=UPI0024C64428|nr:hypothetical protein [Mycoplasmopsis cynos]WAM09293.1 hypothetical protein ONA24_04340 [Mycoplasmopsis cynos]
MFTNQLNNDVTVQKRAKIYKLANILEKKIDKKKITTFFANIGITFLNDNEYLIVVPETDNQNNIIRWRNAKIDNATNGIIKRNNLKDYLTNNKLTLKAKINENGFVEKVPDFTNSVLFHLVLEDRCGSCKPSS